MLQPQSMSPDSSQVCLRDGVSGRAAVPMIVLAATFACSSLVLRGAAPIADPAWRTLPLITDGKVDPGWVHVGWGGFVVDDGVVRTECDPKGLGLLVYKKERFGIGLQNHDPGDVVWFKEVSVRQLPAAAAN